MKKIFFIAAALLTLAACKPAQPEQKVMARPVPERMDDFVFENNLVAGRLYGKALEGNPTSPGIDIWVKMPGKLVANEWYAEAQKDADYYHHNHGDGKDCYKVSVSLGGGASAILIDGAIQYPATNYRSYEILEETPDKVVFVLHYPAWETQGETIALDKKITVCADSYFCKVEDTYTFSGEKGDVLPVAAGIFRHPTQETIEGELTLDDRYAIWEHASDQSIEPEDGMLGVAVVVPGADAHCITESGDHGLCAKNIKSGETFTYYFGSCWSKGDVKTADAWFKLVKDVK
ncbi:MAG: DUF4861 family protein [Bacteroidales bacterium]|nr:DUF4861 family protein [Bacteroidales bacterium]